MTPLPAREKKKGPKRDSEKKAPQKISSLDMDVPCINVEGPNSVPADLALPSLLCSPSLDSVKLARMLMFYSRVSTGRS